MKKVLAIGSAALLSAHLSVASATDQIKIVGSSTVFPFSSYVADEFGSTSKYPTPVVESTGSGGGMKLFCAGTGLDTPSITNASRRMKAKEFDKCQKNGVTDITEAVIGFDGIAIAQSKEASKLNLKVKDLTMAVAKEVPNKAGTALIPNPYKFWDEINPSLPHRAIRIYGPPTSSGTRDAFEDFALKHITKHMPVYTNLYKKDKKKYKAYKKYHKIRQDGVYVPSGENDNLIVQKLQRDKDALGIFGYSYLEENADSIAAASINGVLPSPKTVASGQYPFSRSLYFYIKHAHLGKVKGIMDYANLFMSEDMIGEDGALIEIGLIAEPKSEREKYRRQVKNLVKLTKADFAK
ncbi:MAG: phosphate-binding protein [Gammaproteobacteria bacterium]|nr:MAG: phosphate-binding protein [Gammaproteobacteria bacterium]